MFSVTMTSKSAGRLKQMHRGRVDEQVLDRELGELVAEHARRDVAP